MAVIDCQLIPHGFWLGLIGSPLESAHMLKEREFGDAFKVCGWLLAPQPVGGCGVLDGGRCSFFAVFSACCSGVLHSVWRLLGIKRKWLQLTFSTTHKLVQLCPVAWLYRWWRGIVCRESDGKEVQREAHWMPCCCAPELHGCPTEAGLSYQVTPPAEVEGWLCPLE